MEPGPLFVSCVDGLPVTRYGSRVMIGADRDPADPSRVIYRTDEVVMIPLEEAVRYRREYARQLSDGALEPRTAADWEAQNQRHADAEKAHAEAKAERKRKRDLGLDTANPPKE